MQRSWLIWLLFLLALAEAYAHAYLPGSDAGNIIYLACGVFAGLVPLIWPPRPRGERPWKYLPWVSALAMAGFTFWAIQQPIKLFERVPIDYTLADMLPVIQHMLANWFTGEDPYQPIAEIWNGLQPRYLPAMWTPYAPSVAFALDPRWLSVFFFLAATALALTWRRASAYHLLVIPVMALIYYTFIHLDDRILALTEEPVVVMWYMLFGAALLSGNPWFTGFAIAACLLSRYALVLWTPMLFVYLWWRHSRKHALQVAGAALLTGLAWMTISNSWHAIPLYLETPAKYMEGLSKPENEHFYDEVFDHSLGMGRYTAWKDLDRLNVISLVSNLTVPWLLLLFFRRRPTVLFTVCSLKICLAVFYSLLVIPYLYLFFTNTFFTVMVILAWLRETYRPSPTAT